jgi:hypothetical protein
LRCRIAESRVPFILNYPLNETYAERAAPSMVWRREINGGSAIAQFGIHGIAKRVAE